MQLRSLLAKRSEVWSRLVDIAHLMSIQSVLLMTAAKVVLVCVVLIITLLVMMISTVLPSRVNVELVSRKVDLFGCAAHVNLLVIMQVLRFSSLSKVLCGDWDFKVLIFLNSGTTIAILWGIEITLREPSSNSWWRCWLSWHLLRLLPVVVLHFAWLRGCIIVSRSRYPVLIWTPYVFFHEEESGLLWFEAGWHSLVHLGNLLLFSHVFRMLVFV